MTVLLQDWSMPICLQNLIFTGVFQKTSRFMRASKPRTAVILFRSIYPYLWTAHTSFVHGNSLSMMNLHRLLTNIK